MSTRPSVAYAWILSVILGSCAVLVLLILPSLRRIRELNTAMMQKKMVLEQLYEQGQSTKKIVNNLERVQELIPIVNRAFLYRGEELAFITTLEAAAAAHSLTHTLSFSDVSRNGAKKGERKGTTEVPLSLTVTGTYRDVVLFLSDVDRLPFYVTVRSVSMSGNMSESFIPASGVRSAPREALASNAGDGRIFALIEAITYWREKQKITTSAPMKERADDSVNPLEGMSGE